MNKKKLASVNGRKLTYVLLGILLLPSALEITYFSFRGTPLRLKVAYVIAMVAMIGCITWIEKTAVGIGAAAAISAIFGVIFCTSKIGIIHGRADTVRAYVLCLTLIAPCFFIGSLFAKAVNKTRKQKRNDAIDKLRLEIDELQDANDQIDRKIRDREDLLRTVALLRMCGGATKDIENYKNFQEIAALKSRLEEGEQKIRVLHEERVRLSGKLDRMEG